MERVAVIIPNWNGLRFLDACLLSLRRQDFKDFVTYVVDNGSVDESVEHLITHYPEVRIVRHAENLGFSTAINAGIRASSGQYIAALNNDTEVDPAWLAELVKVLDARPEIGFCASKILDFTDRNVIDSFGDGYGLHGIAFKNGSLAHDDERFSQPVEVFSACAAASIYRRSMLNDIGMFDDDFFCYMEDVDLGIRARLAGYRCLAVATARIYHIGSASTGGDMSEFSLRMTAKNFIHVIIKNVPIGALPIFLPAVLLGQIVIVGSAYMGQRKTMRKNIAGYWRGLTLAMQEQHTMWGKRRAIQAHRRIGSYAFLKLVWLSMRQRRALS